MLKISDAFKKMLEQGERNYSYDVTITLKDGTALHPSMDEIWDNFKIEDAVSGESSFQIGAAIINKLDLTLVNMDETFSPYDFQDAQAEVSVGLELPDGSIEKIKKGVFYVDDSHHDTDLLTLECLDNMARFDRSYALSTLTYPATRGEILRDACTCCGVILDTVTFDGSDRVVSHRPDDEALTFRQVISWVAQLSCKWARCNHVGHLELGWYDMTALAADSPPADTCHQITELTGSPTIAEDDVVITGIRVSANDADGNEKTYFFGSEGYILSVEGNDLIGPEEGDTVAAELGEKLIGISFRPIEFTCPDDPSREAGDVFELTDDRGHTYRSVMTRVIFKADNDQDIACKAESPAKNSSTRYAESTRTYVKLRQQMKEERDARQQAVDDLAKTLAESSGMYLTAQTQEDGSTISYLHDKPTLKASKNVIKLTAEAVGVSNDGGKTYPYGFTLTGALIARLLYAEGINADYITAGALTVKDKDGNIVFKADMNTGQVTISGDYVSIGSQTATKAIQDALDKANEANQTAASAKNMAMSLSNDYQGIPVDADGNYKTFPECKTQVTVMYGSADVSADCVYEVTQSAAVTGTWDRITRTYTVTALAADSGWVDIKATYLGTLAVSKRFTIVKQYAGKDGLPGKDGAPGADGRTYMIESSTSLLKIEPDGFHSPDVLTFSGYYLEGAESGRKAYAGRFIIEASADGATWNTVYRSETDESSVSYIVDLGLGIGDDDGAVLADEDGSILLAESADVAELRCTLYAAGGTDSIIDTISIPAVKSMDTLTPEEIFNLLTNNGEVKGIYKIGNQLYMSFTYMRGGKLSLGGPNNGNGEVHVYDESGKEVGYWTKDGFYAAKGIFAGDLSGAKGTFSGDLSAAKGTFAGELSAPSGNIGGFKIAASALYSGSHSTVNSAQPGTYVGPSGFSNKSGTSKYVNIQSGYIAICSSGGKNSQNGIFIQDTGSNYRAYLSCDTIALQDMSDTLITEDIFWVDKTGFYCNVQKNRIADTDHYGTRILTCYEMGSPMFGDIGNARIGADGMVLIAMDDVFFETVDTEMEYFVFLQREGEGDLYVADKKAGYFVVKGTPGLSFSWEVKARQKDYKDERLESFVHPEAEEIDYGAEAADYVMNYFEELEETV